MRLNRSCRQARRLALLGLVLLGLAIGGCRSEAPPPAPPNVAQVMKKVLAMTPDPERGRVVFKGWCMFCHGDQASGEPPTDFDLGDENPRRFRGFDGLTFEDHVKVILTGFVSKQSGRQNMPAFLLRLTPQQIADVAAYEQGIMKLAPHYTEPERRRWMAPGFK